MKRALLLDQWRVLDAADLKTLNVGAGTIDVHDGKGAWVKHRLTKATLCLIKHAYEAGLARKAIY